MLKFPSTFESLNLGNSFNQSLEGVNLPSSLQTLTFGIMFMRLYDYLSQEQTSGFIYNKVPYFAPSEMEDFTYIYIYIYVKNILGCKLSMHFTNNQKLFFSPASEIYVYIYIYIYTRFRPPYPLNLECCILSCSP